jgi:hypothetical protein
LLNTELPRSRTVGAGGFVILIMRLFNSPTRITPLQWIFCGAILVAMVMVLFLYILMFFHPMDLFDQPVKHIAQGLL